MDEKYRKGLSNENMLLTLVTAILKKNEGEIRISESEMDSVTKKDMVMMYWDKNNSEIILSLSLLNPIAGEEEF
tara:strand:+ start:5124 stop:5345 length:222 start_codon:yes stop_codon:yes gene_type:complete